ncbi:MAG: hypothetical protein F2612_00545 [Actinobacteria bacterium]|uniref:Unannotated protein n=1 Tax=freshwater metagenome TaxID=449393 RepID=A0A6J6ISR2_9ZZZZ|nr:hypothetical protein [Actinomycetota bacterium]
MFGRRQDKDNKPVFIDKEQLDADYEEKLKQLDRDEQKFAKEQKKADELIQQAEEVRKKQEARRLEIDEQRLRHEAEEAKRKAKKDAEALSKNPQPKEPAPLVIAPVDSDSLGAESEPPVAPREPLVIPPVSESSTPVPDATENVVSPVIGSSPSIFFRTPWSKTEKPLHGLSMNGYAGDVHCDAGTFGKIASVGATLRGLKHQVPDKASGAAGQNEDWFSTFCAVSADGAKYVVSVVCDGLSSASYSWYGARRTSTLLGRDVAAGIALLTEVNSRTLQSVVDNSLAEQASTLMTWNALEYGAPQVAPSEVDPVALGCTVTLAVVCADPDSNGSHAIVAGNVGDSPVFNLSKGAWRKVSPPDIDSGDILDTKTHAFPRHTECALVDDVLAQGECVLMTSDGVGNFILRNGMTLALGGYLSTRWNAPIGVLTFLNQLNFDLTTADDDRTAVAFWPA